MLYLPQPTLLMRAAEPVTDLVPTSVLASGVTQTEEQAHSERDAALEPDRGPRPRRPRAPWLRQVFERVTEALP